MVFGNKYSNMSSYKHLLTLMTGGELSFRIPPVSESCAASITIRQRWASGLIGRRLVYRTSLYWALIKRMERGRC